MSIAMKTIAFPVPPHQRGTALVIALVFLLLMTLLAITAVNTSSLEEKMAGNLKDQHFAFQAAEAALREGEAYLAVNSPVFDASCTNGFCLPAASSAPLWDNFVSWGTSSTTTRAYGTGTTAGSYVSTTNVAAEPRYMIEDLGGGSVGDEKPDSFVWKPSPDPKILQGHYFRVTARGVGGTNAAQAMLQTTYVK
jgi:type IV pilus assembly protein PilX